jgi:hypothetical protein
MCITHLVYSQIWINISINDGHFFLHLPVDDRPVTKIP